MEKILHKSVCKPKLFIAAKGQWEQKMGRYYKINTIPNKDGRKVVELDYLFIYFCTTCWCASQWLRVHVYLTLGSSIINCIDYFLWSLCLWNRFLIMHVCTVHFRSTNWRKLICMHLFLNWLKYEYYLWTFNPEFTVFNWKKCVQFKILPT